MATTYMLQYTLSKERLCPQGCGRENELRSSIIIVHHLCFKSTMVISSFSRLSSTQFFIRTLMYRGTGLPAMAIDSMAAEFEVLIMGQLLRLVVQLIGRHVGRVRRSGAQAKKGLVAVLHCNKGCMSNY